MGKSLQVVRIALPMLALGLAGCFGRPALRVENQILTAQGEILEIDGTTVMPGRTLQELIRALFN